MNRCEQVINEPVIDLLQRIAQECHDCSVHKGWYQQPRDELHLIALIHSELSECVEALRNGHPIDKHLPHLGAPVVELADAVIRIFDMAVRYDWPIGQAIIEKMRYNWTREQRHGGKRY